jgi:HAMP domain-containing protein
MIRNIQIDISKKFLLLFAGLIFMTAISARLFHTRQETTDLQMRLNEKAIFINNFYSYQIADSLARKDDVTLLQAINRLDEDPEITSVVVVDQNDQIRYHPDPQKMDSTLDDPQVKGVLKSGEAFMANFTNAGGRALALVSPLRVAGMAQPIGAVRIEFTYNHIAQQIESSRQHYWFIIFGSVVTCIGLVGVCVNKWVLNRLQAIRTLLTAQNAAAPEPNLPEGPDEIGLLSAGINDLVQRFKSEMQQHWSGQQQRGEQEKLWIQQLGRSFMPDARLIVADKDNRILSDSANGAASPAGQGHLMDLIKDSNFATLLTSAFQKEGEVVRGPVVLQDKSYLASILSVPLHQSVSVKTLIALQPK